MEPDFRAFRPAFDNRKDPTMMEVDVEINFYDQYHRIFVCLNREADDSKHELIGHLLDLIITVAGDASPSQLVGILSVHLYAPGVWDIHGLESNSKVGEVLSGFIRDHLNMTVKYYYQP